MHPMKLHVPKMGAASAGAVADRASSRCPMPKGEANTFMLSYEGAHAKFCRVGGVTPFCLS